MLSIAEHSWVLLKSENEVTSPFVSKEAIAAFNSSVTNPYLHTPGITDGIRPGLGGQHHYCDCSSTNKLSTHFVTVLVSVQYLSLLCMKYCAVLSGLKQWRPEYMPSSTPTTISPVSTSTSAWIGIDTPTN